MGDDVRFLIEQATRAGEALLARGEVATAAVYDSEAATLRLELANGAAVEMPVALIEGLAGATESQRAEVEVSGVGYGLHWPSLDLDLSVPGLLAGVFGTERWLNRQRAARAGAGRSPSKAAAARRNGAKGGRPRKKAQ
jgi:hypothetical protein